MAYGFKHRYKVKADGPKGASARSIGRRGHDVFNERSVVAMAITSQPQRAGFSLTYPLASWAVKMLG
jgi:hypothetical protein